MQNDIVYFFNATACAQWRCFECNLRMENVMSFDEATCLWSLQSVWILRGNTVYILLCCTRYQGGLVPHMYVFTEGCGFSTTIFSQREKPLSLFLKSGFFQIFGDSYRFVIGFVVSMVLNLFFELILKSFLYFCNWLRIVNVYCLSICGHSHMVWLIISPLHD